MKQVYSLFPSLTLLTCTVPETSMVEKLSFFGLQRVGMAQASYLNAFDRWEVAGGREGGGRWNYIIRYAANGPKLNEVGASSWGTELGSKLDVKSRG
ncbi:hypothetical protein B0H11DRAFT_2022724 [Mycena galericulata]|nr:hypothetical protein B0H11DRAFT_2022724 [Mycena galericulata]